jgi:hypothetical protein
MSARSVSTIGPAAARRLIGKLLCGPVDGLNI